MASELMTRAARAAVSSLIYEATCSACVTEAISIRHGSVSAHHSPGLNALNRWGISWPQMELFILSLFPCQQSS